MLFKGISRAFSLKNGEQYETIGNFWDEAVEIYGLESLIGLGYKWEGGYIYYAIGLKNGEIDGANFECCLPDVGWETVSGLTDELSEIYDEIYKDGVLRLELETFTNDGKCEIRYIRDRAKSDK